jgi:hypothetical protein
MSLSDTLRASFLDIETQRAVLGNVVVTDKSGSVYTFPDMNVTLIRKILPESGRVPTGTPCLCLVNATMSVLSVPFRNVEKVCVEDEVVWHAPS